jgi:hypothetical protein
VRICQYKELMSKLSPDQWQALSPRLDQAPPTFVCLGDRLLARTSWRLLPLIHSAVRGRNWCGFLSKRAAVPTLDSITRGSSPPMVRESAS